ncbi:MAG: hypothetical protein IKQ41_09735 [Clostridia bacterium]|nr:hypothetical protein [Clostridia bacterium]
MKSLLEKLKGWKGGVWVLVLLACAAACLLLPGGGASGPGMTEEEQRISATLSQISGAGQTRVSIYYARAASAFSGEGQSPVGAVIVSQGARDVGVRLRLMRAAQTLLGLQPGEVEVFSMEDEK